MEQRLIAFWENSSGSYPRVLSGEVMEFHDNGRVSTKEYGGMYFKTIMVLPFDDGLKVQKHLRDLAEEYRAELDSLNQRFKEKLGYIGVT